MASLKARLLWKLYGGLCGICGRPIDRWAKGPGMLTVDEIIPKSKGGTRHPSNQQPAHAACNRAKGDRTMQPVLYPERSHVVDKRGNFIFELTTWTRVSARCPVCGYFLEHKGVTYRCAYRKRGKLACKYKTTEPPLFEPELVRIAEGEFPELPPPGALRKVKRPA